MSKDLLVISKAIDKLLDRPKWTRHELAFYQMLLSKVREYRDHLPRTNRAPKPIRDLSNDITDIRNNMTNQPWFRASNNQGSIMELYGSMKIVECKHQGGPEAHNYHYRLDLELHGGIHLVMEVVRDARTSARPPYHFRVHYESHGVKGHIAAYTPGKSKGHQLPEYDHLSRILPGLARHEIVCLAIELVIYYDVDNIMSKLPLGNSYPITLIQLMDAIKF